MSHFPKSSITRRRVIQVMVALSIAATPGCLNDAEVTNGLPEPVIAFIDLTIGELEGESVYEFGAITGLAGNRAGHVFVSDGQADEIRMYGSDGVFLRRIARRGSGPSEVRSPCCLALDPAGRLWVRDNGNSRYNWYDIGESDIESGSVRMVHTDRNFFAPPSFGVDGHLIDIGHRREAEGQLALVRFHRDPDGEVVREEPVLAPPADSLAEHQVEGSVRGRPAVFYFQQPFGPFHLIAHSPRGGWADAVSSRYAIRWIRADSTFDVRIEREWDGPVVTEAERDTALADLERRISFAGVTLSDLPFSVPARKAPLSFLRFDQGGRLWVFLTPQADGPPEAHVYRRDGIIAEVVRWPRDVSLRLSFLDEGFALGVTRDSLDVQRVVRLKWSQ